MEIHEMLERLQREMGARQVYGEPVERDGVTVIPAAVVIGGGGGGGEVGRGSGSGFGQWSFPSGAYVIRDGRVSWRPAFGPWTVLAVGALAARGLLRRRG
jgi:uncharacterized spore protein YtfJ